MMLGHIHTFVNLTNLCGSPEFTVWNKTKEDFGPCFQNLCLIFPAQALLSVVSAYYLGFQASQWYLRTRLQKTLLIFRSLATLSLALLPIVKVTILYLLDRTLVLEHGEAGLLAGAVECFSWSLHLMYTFLLHHRLSLSIRGPVPMILAWLSCLVVNLIQCHTAISEYAQDLNSPPDRLLFIMSIISASSHFIYLLTLVPAGDQRASHYQELDARPETDSLLGDVGFSSSFRRLATSTNYSGLATSTNYGGFAEDNDPHYLGVAKDASRTHWVSKLLFAWVNPLIKKGIRGLLQSSYDVFDLPEKMTPHLVSQKVRKEWETLEKEVPLNLQHNTTQNIKLLTLLRRCYGREFFAIGGLKFLADCAGFAGPILLNLVVTFMEDPEEDISHGYLYAFLLAFSSLVGALCNCHFNLFMNELGLKVRAAMTTAVYQKTFSVSSTRLNKFTTGQIINFMSTDTDRIVNFCPSFHAAWSLPFQFGITILLLYDQIGISFLSGLGFTILIIPVNKCIANKIGTLSTRMMRAKDKRVASMSEILSGMRVIKYFNWQKYFSGKVNESRKEELKQLKGRKYLDALCVFLWATTPVLISVLTFMTYVLLGNQLTAAKVFTSVALFAMLTGPLNAFPWVLNGLVESTVSIRRLEKFFSMPEFSPDRYFSKMYEVANAEDVDDTDVVVRNATFLPQSKAVHFSDSIEDLSEAPADSNPEPESIFKLSKLNMTIKRGELVGVLGPVGAGKSSFLMGLLGELERGGGEVAVTKPAGGFGFVKQEAWIQQGTIRDNILFGKAYQHTWYNKVTEACALKEDFNSLVAGDLSKVGEAGQTLSGGQKARVALARAVYQDKDIYLIDDVFSAVDSQVAAFIFRKCIAGLLKEKTVILCTHHSRYLSGADQVIYLVDGVIVDQGSPSRILPKVSNKSSSVSASNFSVLGELVTPMETGRNSPTNISPEKVEEKTPPAPEPVQNNEETRETGSVKFEIYKTYWIAVGHVLSPTILFSLLAMQVSRNLTDVWLANWVSQNQSNPINDSLEFEMFDNEEYSENLLKYHNGVMYYLIVYGSIAGFNTIFSFIRAFLFAYGGICAAQVVHTKLLRSVIKAKTTFFDVTPVGRILNRFSSDLNTVDDSLPFILNIFLANLFGVVGPLIVTIYAVPWICIVLLPLTFIYIDIQRRYRPASRDLKRIGSVALSPIYSHFSESLSGVSTIRAMNAVPRFIRDNEDKLEAAIKASYAGQAASQWLEIRLQLIGCGVVAGVAVIAVIQHHVVGADPGMIGLAISYALGITGKLSGLVGSFTETEKELVAVERCSQYIKNIPIENNRGTATSPYNWPSEGVVSMRNVSLRYQDHLPRALKDVTFITKAGEKMGIVGRTGSGKSSLFQCLFRMTEIEAGEIYIDNVNIRTLDLDELREHLVIIPQEPFLFSGTIRENLDPYNFCSDRKLLEAIRRAKLDKLVGRMGGLSAKLEERGLAMSAGQRQLLCLARAILSPAKVVLVDEATANVDSETDRQLQEVIQTSLADRTVLTIAHRVDTVLGCDRVLVMQGGSIVESGHPNILLQDSTTHFSNLVANL